MMDITIGHLINSTVRWTTAATPTPTPAATAMSSHTDTYGGDVAVDPTDYDYYEAYDGGDFGVCEYGRHASHFLPVLYSLFFVVGLPGIVLVLWVILFREKLRSMTDVCLLNLALADLLLVCSLPFLAHQARDRSWPFGDAACKLVLGAYHVGLYCGIFFVTLMSVDRYLAIVHAVHTLRTRTRSVGMAAAAVVWLAGVLASFPDVGFVQVQEAPRSHHNETAVLFCAPLYVGDGHHGINGTATTHNRHFWTIFGLFKMNILGLLIPMAVMGFCYVQIVRRLRSSQSPDSAEQAIRMVVVAVVVFFCCWVPYNVASFFKALELLHVYISCESSKAIHLALQITEAVAYSHSCLNPILYVFVERKFMRHLRKLTNAVLCWLCQVGKSLITQDRAPGSVSSQITCVDERSTVV